MRFGADGRRPAPVGFGALARQLPSLSLPGPCVSAQPLSVYVMSCVWRGWSATPSSRAQPGAQHTAARSLSDASLSTPPHPPQSPTRNPTPHRSREPQAAAGLARAPDQRGHPRRAHGDPPLSRVGAEHRRRQHPPAQLCAARTRQRQVDSPSGRPIPAVIIQAAPLLS